MKLIKSVDELPSVRDYLHRIGAVTKSFRTAIIQEAKGGYRKNTTVIRFELDGHVKVKEETYSPTPEEQKAILSDFVDVKFPTLKKFQTLMDVPEEFRNGTIYEIRDKEGIIMLQIRKHDAQGKKYYLPLTLWDDDLWRTTEPEGLLPLWGMDRIKDQTTAFIHEGAKSAKAAQDMIEAKTDEAKAKLKNHPWADALKGAVHLGWIGGAPNPEGTDWGSLRKAGIQRIYIVSDNDPIGVSAVPVISRLVNLPAYHVQFTSEWPATFDLADDFPPNLFRELDGVPRYIGPTFQACLHPATWATDMAVVPGLTGKPKEVPVLRESFRSMWAYVEEADAYVCMTLPNIVRSEEILNKMLCAFSHSPKTCSLLLRDYIGRSPSLCYRPDRKGNVITHGTTAAINLHSPTQVRNEEGDPAPFLEFMDYLFPNEEERLGVERWCATIIGRLDIHMEYGLLLVSENTGIGKSTLGSRILAPLVGTQNTSWPRESDIVDSSFNDWAANKRLIIMNEIYSGHSWKAYHSLKSLITDREITVNQKYQRAYTSDNWAHVFACSNSFQALKMEQDDRRWFYPQVNEVKWPKEKFGQFLGWLESGGLGIIKTWAENYGDYITPGDRPPMTERKKAMIESSRSEAQSEAVSIAEALLEYEGPAAVTMKSVITAVRNSTQGRVYETDYELRKPMIEAGVSVYPKRMKADGRTQYVLMNARLWTDGMETPKEDDVRKVLIKPADLIKDPM